MSLSINYSLTSALGGRNKKRSTALACIGLCKVMHSGFVRRPSHLGKRIQKIESKIPLGREILRPRDRLIFLDRFGLF